MTARPAPLDPTRPRPARPHAPRRRPTLPRATRRAVGGGALVAVVTVLAVAAALGAWAYARERAAGESAADAMASGRYALAAERLRADVEAGDPRARTALGNLHYLGLGVPADARRAAELYHAAARDGFASAQLNLGNLYRQGAGVPSDPLRAFGWYRQADIHGAPAAEYYLRQISLEYTISPLQQEEATRRWDRLDALVAEPL